MMILGSSNRNLFGSATQSVEVGVGGQLDPDLCGRVVLLAEAREAHEDEIDDEEFEHEIVTS